MAAGRAGGKLHMRSLARSEGCERSIYMRTVTVGLYIHLINIQHHINQSNRCIFSNIYTAGTHSPSEQLIDLDRTVIGRIDNYINPRWACAPRVNNSQIFLINIKNRIIGQKFSIFCQPLQCGVCPPVQLASLRVAHQLYSWG